MKKTNGQSTMYGHRWRVARAEWLRDHPLCADCTRLGKVTAGQVVDHIDPHRGDPAKFWNRDNWQTLCKPCHDRHKQALEKSGRVIGCDAQGIPFGARASWRR